MRRKVLEEIVEDVVHEELFIQVKYYFVGELCDYIYDEYEKLGKIVYGGVIGVNDGGGLDLYIRPLDKTEEEMLEDIFEYDNYGILHLHREDLLYAILEKDKILERCKGRIDKYLKEVYRKYSGDDSNDS